MELFKCKHKFKNISVWSDSTSTPSKDYPKHFNLVTHHLYCTRCNKKLDVKYSQMIGTINEWLERDL